MASISILLFTCIVIYISEGNAKKAFVSVECKTESIGQYGQKSLLECVIKTSEDVAKPQIRLVSWKKEGAEEALLVFLRGKTTQLPGYVFAESSWDNRNMNISLLITDTTVQDEGVYTCEVMTNSGHDKGQSRLKVTAKYSAPTIISKPEKITQNTDVTLMCNSKGGYPRGQLRWFDEHNVDWTKSAEMETNQTESGLFELTSALTLLRGSIFSKYTCVVFNASGCKVDELTFETQGLPEVKGQGQEKGLDSVSKVVAPLVVIGSLIAGLLLALMIRRRRVQQAQRPSATPFMGHHQGVSTGGTDDEEDYR